MTVKRTWCYLLPPLAACRAAFEQEVGQTVDWGNEAGTPDEPEA